jgi:hypothetical protein
VYSVGQKVQPILSDDEAPHTALGCQDGQFPEANPILGDLGRLRWEKPPAFGKSFIG